MLDQLQWWALIGYGWLAMSGAVMLFVAFLFVKAALHMRREAKGGEKNG